MKQIPFQTNHQQNEKIRWIPGIKTIFALSVLIACGGWFFTKQLLSYQEAQLLSRSGQLQIAESGVSLRRQADAPADDADPSGKSSEAEEPDAFYEATLSEDLMAQILDSWKSGAGLLSHDPKEGEMNMEQAIAAGIGWIQNMSQKGFLPEALSENNFRDVGAILYTLDEKPNIPEYLLSRWIISYTVKDIRVTLSIHAATGQVWMAEIIAESSKLPESLLTKDETLLLAAFPFLAEGGSELSQEIESEAYQIKVTSPEDKLSASVWWSVYGDGSKKYTMTTLMLSSRT